MKAAAGPKSERPLSASITRGRGPKAAVLLSRAVAAVPPREGFREALASIPRPDGRPTWFVGASAAGRIGSRTDLPHCVPMRCIGPDGARDWLHQSNRSDHRDLQAPEPLVASALSPDIPVGPALPIATKTEGLSTCSAKRGLNIGSARNRASACLSSVYDHRVWIACGGLSERSTSGLKPRSTRCADVSAGSAHSSTRRVGSTAGRRPAAVRPRRPGQFF